MGQGPGLSGVSQDHRVVVSERVMQRQADPLATAGLEDEGGPPRPGLGEEALETGKGEETFSCSFQEERGPATGTLVSPQ